MAELTFVIETQLADAHAGVMRVRELRKGNRRLLKHGYIFLYQLDRRKETVGETIAHLIYEDQTEDRQGRYQGPRWNRKCATQIHLIQFVQRPEPSLRRNGRPAKREVGTAFVPAEMDAQSVIARIAQVINDGLQLPPDEAYLSPELPNTQVSALTPTSEWQYLPQVVQLTYNNYPLAGSLVFIATEGDGVSIDQCAILPGEHASCPSSWWYHLFAFEDTGEALFLCDRGIHELVYPVFLPGEDDDLPHYWLHEQVRIPVSGGKRVALSRIRNALANSIACIASALPSHSLYCSACHLEHRPALTASVLQEAARRGYVTTLCPHTFWCPTCEKWSSPTERTPLATGEVCTHPRPRGWESRLTANEQQIHTSPSQSARDLAHEKRPLPHPYYDDAQEVEYWLAGMLFPPHHPGKYLT